MASKQPPLPLSSPASKVLHMGAGIKGSLLVQRMPEYVRRALNYPQMDIDYTFWQMIYLCFSPAKVYRTTKYHRQTKNQWARDDPAFASIMVIFMSVSALAYAVAFHRTFLGFFRAIFYSVIVDFLLVGVLISTLMWWIANTYMRIDSLGSHVTEQKVEWLYAFDVHCNSFFPFFMAVNVCQYFLLPLLLRGDLIWILLANLLYAGAATYYIFVSFLGYDILPFLQHTTVVLYPIVLVGVLLLISVLVRFNLCRAVMTLYFG